MMKMMSKNESRQQKSWLRKDAEEKSRKKERRKENSNVVINWLDTYSSKELLLVLLVTDHKYSAVHRIKNEHIETFPTLLCQVMHCTQLYCSILFCSVLLHTLPLNHCVCFFWMSLAVTSLAIV